MIVDPTHVKKYKSTGYYDWGVLCRCDTDNLKKNSRWFLTQVTQ